MLARTRLLKFRNILPSLVRGPVQRLTTDDLVQSGKHGSAPVNCKADVRTYNTESNRVDLQTCPHGDGVCVMYLNADDILRRCPCNGDFKNIWSQSDSVNSSPHILRTPLKINEFVVLTVRHEDGRSSDRLVQLREDVTYTFKPNAAVSLTDIVERSAMGGQFLMRGGYEVSFRRPTLEEYLALIRRNSGATTSKVVAADFWIFRNNLLLAMIRETVNLIAQNVTKHYFHFFTILQNKYVDYLENKIL